MSQNSAARNHPIAQNKLKQTELELSAFASSLNGKLRNHFANRVLRKMLLEPKKDSQGKAHNGVVLWLPSKWSLLVGLIAWFAISHLLARLKFLPTTELLSLLPAIFVAWKFESKLLPKLFFSRYSFHLMRLEKQVSGTEYPDHYIVAHAADSPTGFALQTWSSVRGVEPGHLIISVRNSKKSGVAIIHLRTEGKLAVTSWVRDLYKDNALSPLPEDIKVLAHEFDDACDTYSQVAQRIENSRVLSTKKNDPVQIDVTQAWKSVAISPAVKVRLISLAKHFADGSAAASRGLLLYGPPGTGKTMIAKTLAESMGCAFFPLSLPDL